MPHLIFITFLFALGASIGSFLNVVVWRLPRDESLVHPPSRCPKCGNGLKWYDNIPVFGWLKLRGKCRFCKLPISPRYPIVEAATGLLFVFYYAMYFLPGGKAPPIPVPPHAIAGLHAEKLFTCPSGILFVDGWEIYALYMLLICVLLAASLIDAENFFIPIGMIWYLIVPAGLAWHAIIDKPRSPGTLIVSPMTGALALGGGVGLLVSYLLWRFGILPSSFADGGPLLEVEKEAIEKERNAAKAAGREAEEEELPQYTKQQIRREMRKEMLFLLPPLVGAVLFLYLTLKVVPVNSLWAGWMTYHWFAALMGSVFGLLIGGAVVWLTRILGTLGFGREAMGMGDVHLMAGVGAVIGAGASTVAFFIAPFFGIALAIYMLLTGKRREVPYGPYLSMGTAAVMVFYCDIANWLAPGLIGMREVITNWLT
jgi:leader peptidase (prepilin peptidase)/N-methyltransferase